MVIQENSIYKRIESHLSTILLTKPDKLLRVEELGSSLSFLPAKNDLQRIIKLCEELSVHPIKEVPESVLGPLVLELDNLQELYISITNLTTDTSDFKRSRDKLIKQVEKAYAQLFSLFVPIITYFRCSTNKTSKKESELDQLIKSSNDRVKSVIETIEKSKAKVLKIVNDSEEAAALVGVSKHSTVFYTESQDHMKKANSWLLGLAISIIILITSGFVFIKYIPDSENTAEIINYTVTKLIVLSGIFYSLAVCSKNFRSHKHNQILNKHRQNALNTFETFVNSAGEDEQIKRAVLLEATRTIFSNQQTGYLGQDNDSDQPNKIIEIFKGATSTNN